MFIKIVEVSVPNSRMLNVMSFFLNYVLIKTWLNDNHYDNELGLCNYNIYRFDRCSQSSYCKRRGDVLITIRKNIPSGNLSISHSDVE